MLSQERQENFSRTCWTTFHCRGMSSSISVTSSPILCKTRRSMGRVPDRCASRGRCAGRDDALVCVARSRAPRPLRAQPLSARLPRSRKHPPLGSSSSSCPPGSADWPNRWCRWRSCTGASISSARKLGFALRAQPCRALAEQQRLPARCEQAPAGIRKRAIDRPMRFGFEL
jgi:hypothetical protein